MRSLLPLFSVLCVGLAPSGLPQIPQKEVTFHLAFYSGLKPEARSTAEAGFVAAVAEWKSLVPAQARFKLLPDDTKQGVADFEVVISPETIESDEGCLGYYAGHYKKDRSQIYGVIYIISEWGHWFTPRQEIPMDFWDYKFVAMHEVGHLLGLGHHNRPHGIMNYFDHDKAMAARPTPDEIQSILANRPGLETEIDKLRVRTGAAKALSAPHGH